MPSVAVAVPVAIPVFGGKQLRLDLRQLIDKRLGKPLDAAPAAVIAEFGGQAQQALGLRPCQLRLLETLIGFDHKVRNGNV